MLKFILFYICFFSYTVQAQTPGASSTTTSTPTVKTDIAKTNNTNLSSDALSAKILLEEIIVRRYSQDLSTRLSKEAFSMGAQLEIAKLEMEDIPAQEPMSDLMLGLLDPDELVKKVANTSSAKEVLVNFLSQYTIKNVSVSIGLKQDAVSEAKKTEITEWLNQRLKQEFGSNGTGLVNMIEIPLEKEKPEVPPAPEKPKDFWEQLKDLQGLAGQALLALALILGSLLWGVLAKPKQNSKETVLQPTPEQAQRESEAKERLLTLEKRKNEQDELKKEIDSITQKIVSLTPKTSEMFEAVIRNWCQMGDVGRFRLVCFAEALREDLGKLPIPVDALDDVKKVFSQMPNAQLAEKKEALEKAYWDLLAVLNLGSDAVTEPFSYLGSVNVDTVQNILIEKNPKMKTLVTLYMPDELRDDYIRSLSDDGKKELLQSAAELHSIPVKEFKTIDRQIAHQLNSAKTGDDIMKLELTLQKIISSFTQLEQMHFLKEIPERVLIAYKQSTPSVAFLDQWPDTALAQLMSRATTDEIVNYLHLVPSMQDRAIAVCRPMTAQMVKDELKRPNDLSDNDKNRLLENLSERVQILTEEKVIDLQRIFAKNTDSEQEQAA